MRVADSLFYFRVMNFRDSKKIQSFRYVFYEIKTRRVLRVLQTVALTAMIISTLKLVSSTELDRIGMYLKSKYFRSAASYVQHVNTGFGFRLWV